jgi:hypothetical protein
VSLRDDPDPQGPVGAEEVMAALESIWDSSRELADTLHDRLAPPR